MLRTFNEDSCVVRPPRPRLELGGVQEGERARRHVGFRRRSLRYLRLLQISSITAN